MKKVNGKYKKVASYTTTNTLKLIKADKGKTYYYKVRTYEVLDSYGNRHFWCRGYYVSTAGKNDKKIAEYVRNQLQEDIANDQISLKEYIAPFTGKKVNK